MKFSFALGLFVPLLASAQVLYDPSAGTLPNAQNWSYVSLPIAASLSVTEGAAQLNTQALSGILAGFSRVSPTPLVRSPGFSLHFDLKVLAEDHGSRVDRAGVSVTVLSADKKGIELGFWTDRIWAQSDSPMFTHAEEALWNTGVTTAYELRLVGDTYTLLANGASLLTGVVRDYTSFVGTIDPYETPDFLFFGDNTTSARGAFALGTVKLVLVTTPPPTVSIRSTEEGLVISWPASEVVWTLESSSSLAAEAAWQPVTGSAVSNGVRQEVAIPVTESHQFFRLRP